MDRLDEIRQACLSCRECPLCRERTNVVFGTGDPTSELMFIGEGPGENEDLQGEPDRKRSITTPICPCST